MKLYLKASIVLGALACALYLTIHAPSSKSLRVFGSQESEAAPGKPVPKAQHDLTALKIFNVTLVRLRDNYVDPTRIDTKEMLLKALDSVQRNVAEVLVEPRRAEDKVLVQVNAEKKLFDLKDVDSPWRLATRLKEVFKFIQTNMNAGSDAREIEYAAVNGMLSTLDPHSTLLDPDSYKEMRVNTSQKFGGLGIVIGIRKDRLTVINPMPDTPASRAGIKSGDQIERIDDEATINMTLTEAVNRLRGDPDTKVNVWIARKGEKGPEQGGLFRFQLTRAEIHVDSVESRMLKNGVGYFKVKQFGATTTDELKKAMGVLKKQGAKAWVLDLRWNPGGLLDQAIKMSDLFLEKGTIVTTVGYAGKQRDERKAVASGTDMSSPIAVILNGGSASASEIVAGALKNQDRAVIVGQTSFGKGSVQVLFDNDDESALKLTIAQYLTPGDISIQSVGVPPDIALIPARIPDKMTGPTDRVRYLAPMHLMRESDLEGHLDHESSKKVEKAGEELVYLYTPPPKKAGAVDLEDDNAPPEDPEEEAGPDEEPLPEADVFWEDFEIQFARDLVAQAKTTSRRELVNQSKSYLQKRRLEEDAKIAGALGKLGVNWEKPGVAGSPSPALRVKWSTDRAGDRVSAGEVLKIKAEVSNDGPGTAFQVRGLVKTDDYTFDDMEFVFGAIKAGETKVFENQVRIPKDAITRLDALKLDVKDHAMKDAASPAPLKVTIDGLPRPTFGYTYQIIDDVRGNRDGLLQRGEEVRLYTAVHNLGPGVSQKTLATLKNNSGDGVVVNKGRFDLGEIAPSTDKAVDFTFEVSPDYEGSDVQIEVMVYDQTLREYITEKITFPIVDGLSAPTPATGFAKLGADVWVYEGAMPTTLVIGKASAGSVFKLLGKQGNWYRIEVAPGRPGFIQGKHVTQLGTGAVAPKFAPRWAVTPPTIAMKGAPLEVMGPTTTITGTATDDRRVEDVYVFVSNRGAKVDGKKVFYTSNRSGKTPAELKFEANLQLWPGNNVITIIARENNEVQSRQTVIIYRPEPAATAAVPPKPVKPTK